MKSATEFRLILSQLSRCVRDINFLCPNSKSALAWQVDHFKLNHWLMLHGYLTVMIRQQYGCDRSASMVQLRPYVNLQTPLTPDL